MRRPWPIRAAEPLRKVLVYVFQLLAVLMELPNVPVLSLKLAVLLFRECSNNNELNSISYYYSYSENSINVQLIHRHASICPIYKSIKITSVKKD